jgi:hypothetical protein
MALKVWLPLLIKYLEALSKRHADKILCPASGAYVFPTEPCITTKMWAKSHKFNVNRLLLSQVAGGAGTNKLWEEELEFFMDLYRAYCHMSFAEMVTHYRQAGKHMHMPRRGTSIGAIYMPTMDTMFTHETDSAHCQ